MTAKVPYYRGVRGSAALATRAQSVPAPAAEALDPGEMRRVPFNGELLGAVRVRSRYAAIPLDAFDSCSDVLEVEEQAAYLHLLRLSVAEGRNWCRIAKRDLMVRLRLSERRLLRVLDGLVEKGFARPLDRDNRGTLWRVRLPRETRGEPLRDDVLVGRAADLRIVRHTGPTPVATTATPTAIRPGPRAVPSEGALARSLALARGRADPEGFAVALREVRELLAEGQSPARIAACIETVRRRAARAAHAGDPT